MLGDFCDAMRWLDVSRPLLAIFGPDWLLVLAYSVMCFLFGVAYAIYRAVDWVERMHAWARAVECEHDLTLAGRSIEPMGEN